MVGIGRRDDPFPRETLAERVANTRAHHAGLGHGTADFHSSPPSASAALTAPTQSAKPARPPAGDPAHFNVNPTAPSAAPSPAQPVKHCWYQAPWGRQPALLLRWRRATDGSYRGPIVVAAPDETGTGWTVVRLWADSSLLTAP
jgi:hypothetical protein